MEKVLQIPYTIDLGNGFTKRTNGKEAIIEPSVIGFKPDYFNEDQSYDVIRMNESAPIYVGDDVLSSKVEPRYVLGDDDTERYRDEDFKRLLFGFIARDFKMSVTIPLLVTGLPVSHYKAQSAYLKEMLEGRKVIEINGEEIVINVQKAVVLPQPIGTYMYLVADEKIDPSSNTLVIDGGYGTLDITEMAGRSIVKRAGEELGVKDVYIEVLNYLTDRYGNMRNLTLANMPNILQNGLKIEGFAVEIGEVGDVKRILDSHFEKVFNFIRDRRFDLRSYDNVVFTGGMALLHEDRIKAKDRNNFIVIENAQEANTLGYFEYGKAVLDRESEEGSTISR